MLARSRVLATGTHDRLLAYKGCLAAVVVALLLYATSSAFAITPWQKAFYPPFEIGAKSFLLGHLGAEHDCVARALVRGDGFSDPFCQDTGATAWVSPLLPLLLAVLYGASGMSAFVTVGMVVVLQAIAALLSGWLVLDVAAHYGRLRLGFWLFLIGLGASFYAWFQLTHDHWIILLFLTALLQQLLRDRRGDSVLHALWHGTLGGLAALTNPILAAAWAVLLVFADRRRAGIPCLVAALIVSPWIARNAFVFGRFVPIKSSGPFELYQSQALEPTGLVTYRGSMKQHPWAYDGKLRQQYIREGEMAFLDDKQRLLLHELQTRPGAYLQKTLNRALQALLIFEPFYTFNQGHWLYRLLLKLIHPLPFLAFVYLALTRQYHDRRIAMIMGLYALYLTPYFFIAYYERYAYPLLGLKVLLVLLALHTGLRRLPRDQAAPSSSVATEK